MRHTDSALWYARQQSPAKISDVFRNVLMAATKCACVMRLGGERIYFTLSFITVDHSVVCANEKNVIRFSRTHTQTQSSKRNAEASTSRFYQICSRYSCLEFHTAKLGAPVVVRECVVRALGTFCFSVLFASSRNSSRFMECIDWPTCKKWKIQKKLLESCEHDSNNFVVSSRCGKLHINMESIHMRPHSPSTPIVET